ncbi:MAG: hypothetical protein ABSC77_11785 [Terracidiphilus sp.]|jgi:hypothetical protein
MKKYLCYCTALMLALGGATAFAADLTGAWTGDFAVANGDSYHVSLTLKQDGTKLTGTVSGAQIGQMEIFDGKADSGMLTFSVLYSGITITCEGVISGGQIKLTSKADSEGFPGGEATLTRDMKPDSAGAPPACPDGGCTPKSQGAADLTGTWTSNIVTPNGDRIQINFTFRQDGAKLTGTVTGPQGDPLEISEGKVDGDKVSFNVSFNGMTIKHDGVASGDTIKLTTKSDNADFPGGEMTLTRAK